MSLIWMAGALAAFFANYCGKYQRPVIVIVEPNKADCFYRTAYANDGRLHAVTGPMDSIMAGLCCGDDVQVYDKVHLVQFGEYIPGDKWITSLQKFAPVGSCTPGELKTLPWNGKRLGVAICFEDTDSAQMRALANEGAGILFFITNDSWFSHSAEAEAHAWQATARAIETGLYVVRVGNNGVTGTIAPDGKASWLLGPDGSPLVDRQGSMLDRVPIRAACGEGGGRRGCTTPYAFLGDWPLGVTFALLMLAMILVKYAHRHEKRRYLSM